MLVKWAAMKTNDVKSISDFVHHAFGINDIEVIESSINDTKTRDKVMDIWVLEFEANEYQKEAIKKLFNLQEIRGYLM